VIDKKKNQKGLASSEEKYDDMGAQLEVSVRMSYLLALQCEVTKATVNIATEDVKMMALQRVSCTQYGGGLSVVYINVCCVLGIVLTAPVTVAAAKRSHFK
jgi:hypothetical protein